MSDNSLFFNDIVSRRDFKEYPVLEMLFDYMDKKFPEFVPYFENVNMVSHNSELLISDHEVITGLIMRFCIFSYHETNKEVESSACVFSFDKTMLKSDLVHVGFEYIYFSAHAYSSNIGFYSKFEYGIKTIDKNSTIIPVTCDQFFNALNPSGQTIFLKHFV